MKIYADYSEEPEDQFLPLPEQLGCDFYDLEMDSYTEDLSFYKKHLPFRGLSLELGCGSGRVCRRLATRQRPFIGIDINLASLQQAAQRKQPHVQYLNMDMVQLGLAAPFNAVIAAYNTLNLLTSRQKINDCLQGCRKILQPGGRFLAQIFIPAESLVISKKKLFQFQMFDRPGGGKVIKEVVKQYQPFQQNIQVEERYRVRPMQQGLANEDWHQIYTAAAFSRSTWLQIFSQAGFSLVHHYSNFTNGSSPAGDPSRLLVHLEA